MPIRCLVCSAPLKEGAHFCGACGTPTRKGIRILNKIDRTKLILSQLERSHQAGFVKEEKYEEQKATYSSRLAELEEELRGGGEGVPVPPLVDAPPPPADNIRGVKKAVIYADPPHYHLPGALLYLLGAGLLVAASLFITFQLVGEGFEDVWIHQWWLTGFSLIGPAIYLFWMWRNDKLEREPWYLLTLILGWGAFSAFLSFIGNSLLSEMGLDAPWLAAPLVEETLKAVGVFWIAKNPEFNNPLDGMIYGFAAGMGFAWVENLFYITYYYEGDLLLSVLRVFVFGLGHGIYTAYTGRSLGLAKIKKGFVRLGDMMPGLLLAMVAHGIYNSDLFEVSDFTGLAIWVILTIGSFTVILFKFMRDAQRMEREWHYDDGLAPQGNNSGPL